jgi:hypothetical protein
MDAVIHNAGVYGDRDRNPGPEGHPRLLAVNTLAPYLLTGLIERPDRLIYLTSDMHVSGDDSLHDLDWTTRRWNGTQAYGGSKLFVTALALALGRRWPNTSATRSIPAGYPPEWAAPPPATSSNKATSPKLGSPSAAVPDATRSGQVWHHHRPAPIAAAARPRPTPQAVGRGSGDRSRRSVRRKTPDRLEASRWRTSERHLSRTNNYPLTRPNARAVL